MDKVDGCGNKLHDLLLMTRLVWENIAYIVWSFLQQYIEVLVDRRDLRSQSPLGRASRNSVGDTNSGNAMLT